MRVLVVDDHPLFLKGVELLLRTTPGYEPVTASSVTEALAQFDANGADLLLLDLNLPGIDGEGLLEAIRHRRARLPTLTMSAETNGPRVLAALEKGALGFVPKSYQPQQMLDAIAKVAKGELFLPDRIADQVDRARRGRRQRPQNLDSPRVRARDHGITPRQYAVLECLAEGYSNKEIATSLSLTEYTVKSHIRALFSALDSRNRTSCVRRVRSATSTRSVLPPVHARRISRPPDCRMSEGRFSQS